MLDEGVVSSRLIAIEEANEKMHKDLQDRLEAVNKVQTHEHDQSERLRMKLARVIKEESTSYKAKKEDFQATEAVNVWAL